MPFLSNSFHSDLFSASSSSSQGVALTKVWMGAAAYVLGGQTHALDGTGNPQLDQLAHGAQTELRSLGCKVGALSLPEFWVQKLGRPRRHHQLHFLRPCLDGFLAGDYGALAGRAAWTSFRSGLVPQFHAIGFQAEVGTPAPQAACATAFAQVSSHFSGPTSHAPFQLMSPLT